MSKISEILNYCKKGNEEEKKSFSNHITLRNLDSATKEKLVNTYIFNPIDKSKKTKEILLHKLHKRNANIERAEIKFAQIFPWLISLLLVLLLLVNIAYRGKINIKIEILNEGTLQPKTEMSKNLPIPIKEDLVPDTTSTKPPNILLISTSLFSDGRLNKDIIKKLGFYGAALSKSTVIRDGFFLFNDGTAGWASVGLDLIEPMDLSNNTLDFFVKGAYGNESLRLFLRDAENNSYMPQAYNLVFDKNMSKEWRVASVSFNNFKGPYNPKRIKHIGFEFGTQTTSNEPGVSIYIKNMCIVKNPITPDGN